jgi:hypothetical protein
MAVQGESRGHPALPPGRHSPRCSRHVAIRVGLLALSEASRDDTPVVAAHQFSTDRVEYRCWAADHQMALVTQPPHALVRGGRRVPG